MEAPRTSPKKKAATEVAALCPEVPRKTTEGIKAQRVPAGSSPQSGPRPPGLRSSRRRKPLSSPTGSHRSPSRARRLNQRRQEWSTNPHFGVHPGPGCWSALAARRPRDRALPMGQFPRQRGLKSGRCIVHAKPEPINNLPFYNILRIRLRIHHELYSLDQSVEHQESFHHQREKIAKRCGI